MFFSVRNSQNDFVYSKVNLNWYSKSLKPNIQSMLPQLRGGYPSYIPFEPASKTNPYMPNLSTPLLNEHFDDFSDLWKDFEEISIITNRRTLRSLTEYNKSIDFTLAWVTKKIDENERIFFILNVDSRKYDNEVIDHVAPLLTQNIAAIEYTDYYLKKLTLNENSENCFNVYFTSEIDASVNGIPIEIKGFNKRNGPYKMLPSSAYSIAIQCHLANVNELLEGIYSTDINIPNKSMLLKIYTVDKLKQISKSGGFDIEGAINRMNNHLCNIFKKAKTIQNSELSKTRRGFGNCFEYNINYGNKQHRNSRSQSLDCKSTTYSRSRSRVSKSGLEKIYSLIFLTLYYRIN